MSRHDDADQIRVDFECPAQQDNAVHFGHHQIGEHKVELLLTQRRQRSVGRSEASSRIALLLQRITEGLHLIRFIIHNEQFGERSSCHKPPWWLEGQPSIFEKPTALATPYSW